MNETEQDTLPCIRNVTFINSLSRMHRHELLEERNSIWNIVCCSSMPWQNFV